MTISRYRGFRGVIYPAWYVTRGYRDANPGALGRSLGCLALDPVDNNQVIDALEGGALVYVTSGNRDPVNY